MGSDSIFQKMGSDSIPYFLRFFRYSGYAATISEPSKKWVKNGVRLDFRKRDSGEKWGQTRFSKERQRGQAFLLAFAGETAGSDPEKMGSDSITYFLRIFSIFGLCGNHQRAVYAHHHVVPGDTYPAVLVFFHKAEIEQAHDVRMDVGIVAA